MEYWLVCAKYVPLLKAKDCDPVCEVGQVVQMVVYPDLCLQYLPTGDILIKTYLDLQDSITVVVMHNVSLDEKLYT